VIDASSGASVSPGSTFAGSRTQVTIGGHVGGGVDVHLGRNWCLGLNAGYNWMADFPDPTGGRDNYSGFELALGFGWLFGKGSAPRY
jgi:hypothetical protein